MSNNEYTPAEVIIVARDDDRRSYYYMLYASGDTDPKGIRVSRGRRIIILLHCIIYRRPTVFSVKLTSNDPEYVRLLLIMCA